MGQNGKENIKNKTVLELRSSILKHKKNQNWSQYLHYATELWARTKASKQVEIEQNIWQTLKSVPKKEQLHSMTKHPKDIDLADWFEFTDIEELNKIDQKQFLKDSLEFNPYAIFNAHLSKELLKKLDMVQVIPTITVHKVAVFLPLTGNYRLISQQIRNGILKNKMKNHPNISIKFYDTSDPSQINEVYKKATSEGADFIIGPLKKETIQSLATSEPDIKLDRIVALNSGILSNFSYNSSTEGMLIVNKFKEKQYKNIAILTSDKNSDTQLSNEVSGTWQQTLGHNVTVKDYSNKKTNYRESLARLINEKESSQRKNNIRWLLKRKIHFTPRVRQDLDAVLLLGDSKHIAVFQPQFKFFNLKIPIYGSSKLTPTKMTRTKPNEDLKGIRFPTYPAAIKPSNLTSKLEAFGWDSFTIATNQHLFTPGSCVDKGMTGRLTKNGLNYENYYVWAKYNRTGIAE